MTDPLSDVYPGERRMRLRACMAHVAQTVGKTPRQQLQEMLSLVVGGQRISPGDYYRLRLYDDHISAEEKRRFVGNNRYWELDLRVNDRRWGSLVDDKLAMAALLGTHGIRTPHIKAVYHGTRSFPGAAALTTKAALIEYLRRPDSYPLFGKRVCGSESLEVVLARSLDEDSGQVRLADGSDIGAEQLAERIHEATSARESGYQRFDSGLGYVLQEVVAPHPRVLEVAGEIVASVRVIVLLEQGIPRLGACTWKIPAPGAMADNLWRPGNLSCQLDSEAGVVIRVIRGVGPELEEFQRNPYTGKQLVGFQLPLFEELKQTVLRGAVHLPGIRFQGWDVAPTPDGPTVLEVNGGSGLLPPQLLRGEGLMTRDFEDFILRAEQSNETRPWGPTMVFNRHLFGHRMGRLHGALETALELLGRRSER